MSNEQDWTIGSVLEWTQGYLEKKGDKNPRLSAERLLSSVTGCERIELYISLDKPLSKGELETMRAYVSRRASGEPLQYIIGTAPFRYLNLKVRPGVLIPRPETEVLVSEVLANFPTAERRHALDSTINEHVGAAILSACSEADAQDAAGKYFADMRVSHETQAAVLEVPSIGNKHNSASEGQNVSRETLVETHLFESEYSGEDQSVSRETFLSEIDGVSRRSNSPDSNPSDATLSDATLSDTALTDAVLSDATLPGTALSFTALSDSEFIIMDICTGSGCIAISLAKENPRINVVATDILPDAVQLAKENAQLSGVEDKIVFLECDLDEAIDANLAGKFDAIVSNPPYVPTNVLKSVPSEVTDYEPDIALDGGEDGLRVYRLILDKALYWLKPGGMLAVELHETCLEEAAEMAHNNGFECVQIIDDLAGKPRVLKAFKKGNRND